MLGGVGGAVSDGRPYPDKQYGLSGTSEETLGNGRLEHIGRS